MRVLYAGLVAALLAATPPAFAASSKAEAQFNGVRHNGLAENGVRHNGVRHNGVRHNAAAGADAAALPAPVAIMLPTGVVLLPE